MASFNSGYSSRADHHAIAIGVKVRSASSISHRAVRTSYAALDANACDIMASTALLRVQRASSAPAAMQCMPMCVHVRCIYLSILLI